MRNRRRGAMYVAIVAAVFAVSVIPAFSQTAAQVSDAGAAKTSSNDEVSLLKRQVAEQQKEIEALQATMKAMKDKIDQGASAAPSASPQAPSLGQVASLTPVVPVALDPKTGAASAPPLKPVPHADAASSRKINRTPSKS
jgi:anti-sigma28 factor (negative regulator of flagellin synthesis)